MRGDFRIAKVIDIGTHMSLVRKPDRRFILLDSYEMDGEERAELLALTDGVSRIDAVLNVHPFHTVHCEFVQGVLPDARLIGTRRHHRELSGLSWDPAFIEDEETQRQFADILDFSIPSGVDFVSDDESVHVGSVIARHRESGIVHVDDTLMYLDLPALLERFGAGPKLRFHPKLADALEKRAGAADDYARWARELGREWSDTRIICAAHKGIAKLTDQTFAEAIETALDHAASTLDKHRETYG